MKDSIRTAMVLVVLLGWAGVSQAQHEGHQMGGAPASDGACIAHAKEGVQVLESANRQLEEARQTNSPQRMRAAMDELQGALGQMKTHLSLCAEATSGTQVDQSMKGMDHSAMPGMEEMKGMDHGAKTTGTRDSTMSMPKDSKMNMLDMTKPPKAPARPGNTKEMDHSQMDMSGQDHSKMAMPGMNAPAKQPEPASPEGKETDQGSPQAKTKDPICFKSVDTRGADKATYKGKTYYFCSRADREKFLSDPAAYVKH